MPDVWSVVDRMTGLQVFCGLLLAAAALVTMLAWLMNDWINALSSRRADDEGETGDQGE